MCNINNLCEWTDEKYECEDGHALITDNNWVLLCPPIDEIVSVSPSVLNTMPSLSPSITVGEYHIRILATTLLRELITALFITINCKQLKFGWTKVLVNQQKPILVEKSWINLSVNHYQTEYSRYYFLQIKFIKLAFNLPYQTCHLW